MRNEKGQGSLEYLIIIAAVLAIAAIVVLFLTGAFKSSGGNAAACKAAAASCASDKATSNGNAPCNYCVSACNDTSIGSTYSADYIEVNGEQVLANASAYKACISGDPEAIYSKAE